ncbi:uncharacterized protein CDAR_39122 [Caerostris darwini]|uniref:Uncharacterized protein n=1 Tax=Caerostris darwini TaxID=1538125 RepID=A0AAV4UQU6_9ARAC|nr:uncharacterized protein CDAR_39122 [Caerostris darwini]
MGVLETVTCCVLALVTFAVFRKEFLKVKDAVVAFWVPKRRKKADDVKGKRRESNKENFFPANCAPAESILRTTSPLKTMENETVTKEVISLTETASKKIEEKGGIRIKSATLLPEKTSNSTDYPFENFTSQKLNEDYGNKQQTENKAADPFPSFSELLPAPQGPPKPPRSPVDTSTSSKTEEIRNDDNTVTKITTETMHEIKGNTEIFHKERTRICVQKYHRR